MCRFEATNRKKRRKREKVKAKERIVVKKETYREGEKVCLQDIKTKLWNLEGVVVKVRTADDGTIVSYDIDVNGVFKTRHRKYMSKIKNTMMKLKTQVIRERKASQFSAVKLHRWLSED